MSLLFSTQKSLFLIFCLLTTLQWSCQRKKLSYEVVTQKKKLLNDNYQIDDIIKLPDGGFFIIGGVLPEGFDMGEVFRSGNIPKMIPYVTKLDPQYNVAWTKQYNELSSTGAFKCIQPVSNNKFLLIGRKGLYSENSFILTVDAKGKFSDFQEYVDEIGLIKKVKKMPDGQLIMTGYADGKMLLARANEKGVISWVKS